MEGWTEEEMDGLIVERMKRWMDGWMDGWMDENDRLQLGLSREFRMG